LPGKFFFGGIVKKNPPGLDPGPKSIFQGMGIQYPQAQPPGDGLAPRHLVDNAMLEFIAGRKSTGCPFDAPNPVLGPGAQP